MENIELKKELLENEIRICENELYANSLGTTLLFLEAKTNALVNVLVANNIVSENNFKLINNLVIEAGVYKTNLNNFREEAKEISKRIDECKQLLAEMSDITSEVSNTDETVNSETR